MSSDDSILAHPFSQFLYYFLLSTIPFYIWRQVTPLIPLDWYVTIVLGAILFVYLVTEKEFPPLFFNNINKWLILFFIVNIAASFLSPYPTASVNGMIVLVQVYIFIFFNLAFLTDRGIFHVLPVVLAVSSGLNGMFAGLDYFFGITPFYEKEVIRAYGLTLGANNLSLMSLFVIPPIVNKLLNAGSPKAVLFYILLIVFNIAGLVSSESRGGFLVFFITLIMILIINRHLFQPRFLGLAISGICLCMVVVGTAIPDTYIQRQQSLLAEQKDSSIQRRTAYIRVAARSFWNYPILGTGPRTFPRVWLDSRETLFFKMEDRGVHNTYLNVLVGTGIVGLAVFAALLFRIVNDFVSAVRNFELTGDTHKMEMTRAYFVSFLSVMVYCLLKTLMDHKYFILILAVSQVIYFISKKDRDRVYGAT